MYCEEMARPTKLTLEIQERLIEALSDGNHIETSCEFAGIEASTYYRWMDWGKKGRKEFVEFCKSIQSAIARAEIASVSRIRFAEERDWKAAAWMLERRHPERWANTQRVKIEVEKELEKTLTALEAKLPPEVYSQLLETLSTLDESET